MHIGVEEFYYVMQGSGTARINNESAPIAKGDAVPVLFNDVHSFENSGSADLEFLIVGVARVFLFEKGFDYYFHSYAFIAKLSVFILIGLLSVFPTVEFLSWNAALREGKVPAISAKQLRLVTVIIHGELFAIVIILLCAAIMARGGWV